MRSELKRACGLKHCHGKTTWRNIDGQRVVVNFFFRPRGTE